MTIARDDPAGKDRAISFGLGGLATAGIGAAVAEPTRSSDSSVDSLRGYFFGFTTCLAAVAFFFCCVAVLAFACFCAACFCVDFGDLSPMRFGSHIGVENASLNLLEPSFSRGAKL
ncbi:MAG: hypothetical protein M3463_07305 [Verrucomicrobiota bacterium]|nr:hypothetical protein [Verrucomicrobiota bacterium]